MTIGEKIQKYRKELGMSQEELGQKLLLSRQTISFWEKDQTVPTLDNLMRLKEILGVTVDELLSTDDRTQAAKNKNSLDSICATLAYAMGVDPPKYAAQQNWDLANYIDKKLEKKRADRVVMYDPDAIAQWIYQKYPNFFDDVKKHIDVEIPLAAVMPSVTPVCFGTMYTGAQPEVHGIQKYEKPVITIDTLFDAMLRAGKKVALITYGNCSLSRIFLERDLDHFHFEQGDVDAVNAKAVEVILRDEHDLIVIYNGNYDSVMHKMGPESPEALGELRANCHVFSLICELIEANWKHHNTLVGFAMDHGCHEIDGGCGSHGLDMVEDINIVHLYKCYLAKEDRYAGICDQTRRE